jgi:hypothetical protein
MNIFMILGALLLSKNIQHVNIPSPDFISSWFFKVIYLPYLQYLLVSLSTKVIS